MYILYMIAAEPIEISGAADLVKWKCGSFRFTLKYVLENWAVRCFCILIFKELNNE